MNLCMWLVWEFCSLTLPKVRSVILFEDDGKEGGEHSEEGAYMI